MLTPTRMRHVRLLALTEDLPRAALALAETESFHPDAREPADTQLSGQPGHDYRDTYQQAHGRLAKIGKLIPLSVDPPITEVRVVEADELAEVDDWLGRIWHEASRYEEELHRLDTEERFVVEQQAALENFAELKVDLGRLHSKTRFLDFYVGIVPRENLTRLEGSVGLAEHLLYPYMVRGDQAHVVIVGPCGEREAQLSSVLASAGFQALPIPSGLDSAPDHMGPALAERRQGIATERAALHARLDDWGASLNERLAAAAQTLALAEPFVALDPALRSAGPLAYLAGWAPARAVTSLERRLRETLTHPFAFESRAPRPDERPLVPSVAPRNRLLQPFRLLVKQYGIPQYGEVDPTPLFAVTFLLMFGTMFGDVGQGAVIAALAWLLRRRLGQLALFGVLAGLSSVGFGVLFGSVFGDEHLLPALWMSPLHDPILMLELALGWGVAFLVLACLLAIYNRLAVGNYRGALLGQHGLINLVFYLALVWGGFGVARSGSFGWFPALLIAASLAALAFHGWRQLDAPPGERLLVVFIETLETVIGYVSNTLSFLRVAAFSLNHVALSIAIFTLADMTGEVGHLVTLILGNLFVILLEGGIVMIQVMRLQYYEGFSRYFSGNGLEFAPLRLRLASQPPAHAAKETQATPQPR
ncbi:archaeal/vacuolar-type H+-ATPase subunit I [Thioflavicoccus mobilis 8321]|uniref:Archaeal/vacuolar-type H+-ATPase subunit I n=1 Tax=Thioflavicoccus mobilis 8321 TaxID=765912 RepID=L0GY23_9GAMM|nr:V-type ATPase 116kDa subunit family protein [Thioflavicoccus mobilis]AGA90280.1 archaeal/vacuolar-type H+-ATPase subunit I [Thioflavicoccus mobilis 8321]